MTDVFISYSRRDKVFTQKLVDALQAANREVWADWASIPAASDWDAEIKEGIEKTNTVLFLLSPEWIKSNECRKEMVHAIQMGKRLVPILHIMPDQGQEVPPELAKLNWVYMRTTDDFDKAFETLQSAMDTDLAWAKTHTRIQVRAIEWNKKNRDNSLTLRGNDLTEGEQFISQGAHKSPEPTELQGAFILASRKDATRRQRITLAGVTVALIVSVALGVVAYFQRQAAVRAEAATLVELARSESLRMVAEAGAILADPLGNPEVAAMLSIKALQNDYYPQAYAALSESISHIFTTRVFKYGSPGDSREQTSVAVSPNGKTLAVASLQSQGLVELYSSTDGKLIATIKSQELVTALAISPDGQILAVAGESGNIALFDLTNFKNVGTLSGHTDVVTSVAFSPALLSTGKYLLSGSRDDTARLWDLSTLKTITSFSGHTNDVLSVAFAPDGKSVFTSSWDQTARRWDIATGDTLGTVQDFNQIRSIAVSNDGKYLATATDRKATIWDLATYTAVYSPRVHPNWVNSVVFSPNGQYFVTGGDDNVARIWDVETGDLKRTLVGHAGRITSVAYQQNPYATNDIYIITGSTDGTARQWIANLDRTPRIFKRAANTITDVALSPDGKTLVTGSESDNSKDINVVWDVVSGKPITSLVGHSWYSSSVSFSTDGQYILTSNGDGTVIVWNAKSGQSIQKMQVANEWVLGAAFSPDGKYILAGSGDGNATLWEVKTGTKLLTMKHPEEIRSVAYSPDGKFAATGSRDNIVRLWDLTTGKVVHSLAGHTQPLEGYLTIESVAFSPDGKNILSASVDGTARLWDVATGKEIRVFKHNSPVYFAVISPDGKYVLTAGADRLTKLWDLESGNLIRIYSGHKDAIFGVAFASDGKSFATTGADTTVRIWDFNYQDTVTYACSLLFRDLTSTEREEYGIKDTNPICSEDLTSEQKASTQPEAIPTTDQATDLQAPTPTSQPQPTALPSGVSETVGLKSGNGSTEVSLKFVNQTGEALKLFWVNFDGVEEAFYDLALSESVDVDTLNTHAWRLRDSSGNLIFEYVGTTAATQRITVNADFTVTVE